MGEEHTLDYEREILISMVQHGYELKEKIGSGGFASVYKCRQTRCNEIFVVKVIKLSDDRKKSLLTSFESEIQTLIKIIHPNVISIYDEFHSDNCLYLILEYCPKGSLDQIIKERSLERTEFIEFGKQILNAIHTIHSMGIVHRDIKPQNILIDSYNRPKLADFGLAEFYGQSTETKRFGGSLPYMAPELLLKKEYTPVALDIWALGITFYQMAVGSLPWSSPNVSQEILSGFIIYPSDLDPTIALLLRRMLEVDPKRRISIEKIMALPMFKSKGQISTSPSADVRRMPFFGNGNFHRSRRGGISTSSSLHSINTMPCKMISAQNSGVFSKKRISMNYTFGANETNETPISPVQFQ